MRGLDADQVYEYLDLLADQIQAADDERRAMRADNERLRGETTLQAESELRSELAEYEGAGDRVNDQVVELFSQAQLVAEEMVEDVSRDARERLGQARAQERQILEEAMADRRADPPGRGGADQVDGAGGVRHVRLDDGVARASWSPARRRTSPRQPTSSSRSASFAQAAQTQMQSIMESFATEVERLGRSRGEPAPACGWPTRTAPRASDSRSWD